MSFRHFVFTFLLFNLNGFIWAGKFNPEVAPKFVTLAARKAIEATKFIHHKPFTIFTALKETAVLNVTKHSISGRLTNSLSVASATGSILGSDIYNIYSFNNYWGIGNCSENPKFINRVIYFNSKYVYYEKALDHPDGIIAFNVEVATNGDVPNPQFDALSKLLAEVKKPGDSVKVLGSGSTYRWYVNYPSNSKFQTYRKWFVDEEYGKKYIAQVIQLPYIPCLNFISKKQFESTFGQIKGVRGDVMSTLFDDSSIKNKQTITGLLIKNLPA